MLRLMFVLGAILLVGAYGAEQPQTSSPSAPPREFFLIADYLPPATYLGDPITCCFRVENATGSVVELELSYSIFDRTGAQVKSAAEAIKVQPKSDAPAQFDLPSEAGASVVFTLKKKDGTEALAAQKVCLLREEDAWPRTRAKNARLETTDGEALIPIVRKRLKAQDRAYAPLKWLVDPAPGEVTGGIGKGIGFVPGGWGLQKAERRVALGPYAPNGVAPILLAAAEIIQAVRPEKDRPAPERVVITLPPEDLDVDTDPRVYKLVLEALLAHLGRNGVRETILIPALQYGSNEKQRDIYWKTTYQVAQAYDCRTVEASEYMRESWWRADPSKEGAYGRKPNKEGLKKFEQALSNLLP